MKRLLLYVLGFGLLWSCQKEDIPLHPAATSPTSLTELLQRNRPAQQRFTFALNQAQAIRTAAGATLSFPANSFRLPDGNVATGQAELRVMEIYGVADMLLANMPTTTQYGELLESGGEFRLQAWQGGVRLRMERGAPNNGFGSALTLESPRPTGQDTSFMTLWKQSANDTASVTGWLPTNNPAVTPLPDGFYQSTFSLDTLSWWNIDQLVAPTPPAVAHVVVPAGATQTRVYFRPQGSIRNSLARVYSVTPDQTRWSRAMPTGMPVLAIVLQAREGKLYFGTQAAVVVNGVEITPPLQELSETEIIRRIRQL